MSNQYFSQPSVMSTQQHFSQVPSAEIPRSKFDRSHAYKTTFDAGALVPIFVDEVLPGDTFTQNTRTFARLATPLKPVMDNMMLDVHFFFVPYRLVWDDFTKFMGERPTPDFDPNTLSIPTRRWAPSMWDLEPPDGIDKLVGSYFGLPQVSPSNDFDCANVSVLPFRAYRLIWNEWYRDQNLQHPIPLNTTSNATTDADSLQLYCLPRGKRHDYFTSALPWPQKGDPVLIPLGGEIPITGNAWLEDFGVSWVPPTDLVYPMTYPAVYTQTAAPNILGGKFQIDTSSVGGGFRDVGAEVGTDVNTSDLRGDLSGATAISINELRTAFQIQKLLERDARGGTRYIELILSHFGVRSDDARLQRPEYLGGGTSHVNINPIASTAETLDVPQANLSGVGTVQGKAGYQKSFTEHGIIIGLVSARADLTYQQGIERFWSRKTRYDFYWPALAHLGEQAILNQELYYGTDSDDEENNQAFGYQERYAEYRYKPSRVTGLFNSNAINSLDVWHLSQDFDGLPRLNNTFIEDRPPIERIIAVDTEPHFLLDVWHELQCQRPMPVYSVPGLVDHF